MWSRTVVIISCAVFSVIAELQENEIESEDILQDLTSRFKKSPAVLNALVKNSGTNKASNIDSRSDITALLSEDIRHKIDDLKELKSAYRKVEADFFGSKESNENSEKGESKLLNSQGRLSENPTQTFLNGNQTDNEKVDDLNRESRQSHQPINTYNLGINQFDQTGYSYSNSKNYNQYPNIYSNLYGDRGNPYIAEGNPYARTYDYGRYESPGDHGGTQAGANQHPVRQLKQLIPTVISALTTVTNAIKPPEAPPTKPVVTAASGGSIHPTAVHPPAHSPPVHQQPVHHPPVQHTTVAHGTAHKPAVAVPPAHQTVLPGRHGTRPIIYSKQIIIGAGDEAYGHSEDYNFNHPGYYPHLNPPSYAYYSPVISPYQQGSPYYYPSYPWYQDGLSYYAPNYAYYPKIEPIYTPQPQDQFYFEPALPLNTQSQYDLPPDGSSFRSSMSSPITNLSSNRSDSIKHKHYKSGSEKIRTLEELKSEIEAEQHKISELQKNMINITQENLSQKEDIGENLLKEFEELSTQWTALQKELNSTKVLVPPSIDIKKQTNKSPDSILTVLTNNNNTKAESSAILKKEPLIQSITSFISPLL